MQIKDYEIEKLKDPTGILVGERYEIAINIEVEEDDELFSEHGIYCRLIYVVDEHETRMVQYQLFEKATDKYLEFELDDEEVSMLDEYCKQQLQVIED